MPIKSNASLMTTGKVPHEKARRSGASSSCALPGGEFGRAPPVLHSGEGRDHHRVNYNLHGRDERLTDVYDARVIKELLA